MKEAIGMAAHEMSSANRISTPCTQPCTVAIPPIFVNIANLARLVPLGESGVRFSPSNDFAVMARLALLFGWAFAASMACFQLPKGVPASPPPPYAALLNICNAWIHFLPMICTCLVGKPSLRIAMFFWPDCTFLEPFQI